MTRRRATALRRVVASTLFAALEVEYSYGTASCKDTTCSSWPSVSGRLEAARPDSIPCSKRHWRSAVADQPDRARTARGHGRYRDAIGTLLAHKRGSLAAPAGTL